jgi:hypothetical protein
MTFKNVQAEMEYNQSAIHRDIQKGFIFDGHVNYSIFKEVVFDKNIGVMFIDGD